MGLLSTVISEGQDIVQVVGGGLATVVTELPELLTWVNALGSAVVLEATAVLVMSVPAGVPEFTL